MLRQEILRIVQRYDLDEEAESALLAAVEAHQGPTRQTLSGSSLSLDSMSEEGEPFRPEAVKLSRAEPDERYIYLGELGRGGMGEVHQVKDRALNRVMALKIIKPEYMNHRRMIARFIEEAQVAAQLQHPSIVPVHEVGQLPDSRVYFTMREVRGRTLADVIDDVHRASVKARRWAESPEGKSLRTLVAAFQRVCEAIAYAHSRSVIHRDLKPENVMIGRYGEVLVLDWGLAKVGEPDPVAELPDEPVATTRTRSRSLDTQRGQIGGTPAFMAPERARGRPASPGSDIYSLGGILYQILTNSPPYTGRRGDQVLEQVRKGPPLHPMDRIPTELQIDAELLSICERSMARNPRQRYQTVEELGRDLRAWQEGRRKQERADAELAQAQALEPAIEKLRSQADHLRGEAGSLLAELPRNAPAPQRFHAWDLEQRALELTQEAELKEVQYLQRLRSSLTEVPGFAPARRLLAAWHRRAHQQAERRGDESEAAQHEFLLTSYDDGTHASYLTGDAWLSLITEPARVRIEIERWRPIHRRLKLEPAAPDATGPLDELQLAKGSYRLTLSAEGHSSCTYPVLLRRGESWRTGRPPQHSPWAVYLPRAEELGPEDRYVPGGWFTAGGDPGTYHPLPPQDVWVDGFVLRRFPVTHGEYLEFLNDLVAQDREAEALRAAPREPASQPGQLGVLLYQRDATGHFLLGPGADREQWQADWPVTMVDFAGAWAFSRWRAQRDGLPWRLPAELEWEKAARGVDGRFFPWGNHLDPSWCRMRDSEDAAHPSPVDSYPVDISPYGVRGMGGNVREWCLDPYRAEGPPLEGGRLRVPEVGELDVARVVRGGSWLFSQRSCRAAFRDSFKAHLRTTYLGFRLCRSLDPQVETAGDAPAPSGLPDPDEP